MSCHLVIASSAARIIVTMGDPRRGVSIRMPVAEDVFCYAASEEEMNRGISEARGRAFSSVGECVTIHVLSLANLHKLDRTFMATARK